MPLQPNQPRYLVPVEIPDGEYWGRWSGHELVFDYDGQEIHQATRLGVRGMNIRTKFHYVNGELDEKSLDPHGPSTLREPV